MLGGRKRQLPAPSLDVPYLSLTFNWSDTIRLINADATATAVICQTIDDTWPGGLQSERNSHGQIKLKLAGEPFDDKPKGASACAVRHLCCLMLERLIVCGFKFVTAVDLKRTRDYSTWLFERQSTNTERRRSNAAARRASVVAERKWSTATRHRVTSIAIDGTDSLVVMNADEKTHGDVIEACQPHVVSAQVIRGITPCEDSPWRHIVFAKLFTQMYARGFEYVGSGKPNGQVDTLFFMDMLESGDVTQFACIALINDDVLKIVNPQSTVQIDRVREVLTKERGEITDKAVDDGHEFHLDGKPWRCSTIGKDNKDALQTRHLIIRVLETLQETGLGLVTALDICPSVRAKSMFILRTCTPYESSDIIAVAPLDCDKLAVIGFDDVLVRRTKECVHQVYAAGLQNERHTSDVATTFKLCGNPWLFITGNDDAWARLMLCHLIHRLAQADYRCVCAADVASNYHDEFNNNHLAYKLDTQTLFFVKN